jgi:hypothetical protein
VLDEAHELDRHRAPDLRLVPVAEGALVEPLLDDHGPEPPHRCGRGVPALAELCLEPLQVGEVRLVVEEHVHLDRAPRAVAQPDAERRPDARGEEEDLDRLRLVLERAGADRGGVERAEDVEDDR